MTEQEYNDQAVAYEAMLREYDRVNDRCLATFPNADEIPCLMIPWGDTVDPDGLTVSGLMVDCDVDPHDRIALRVGIYADLTESDGNDPVVYCYSAADALEVIDFLTDFQPVGTDWAAWATHWGREIWPASWAR